MTRGAPRVEDNSFMGRTKQFLVSMPRSWHSATKLVALVLFAHARDAGDGIYVGIRRQIELTGLPRSTHMRQLALLTKGGFLEDCGVEVHENGARTTLRRLNLKAILAARAIEGNYSPADGTISGDSETDSPTGGTMDSPAGETDMVPPMGRSVVPPVGHKPRDLTEREPRERTESIGNALPIDLSRFDLGSDLLEPPAVRQRQPIAKKVPKSKPEDAPGFAAFWSAYPRKIGKPLAAKAYVRAVEEAGSVQRIADALHDAKRRDHRFKGRDGQFVPHPTTWLNSAPWNDEHVAESVTGNSQLDRLRDTHDRLQLAKGGAVDIPKNVPDAIRRALTHAA